jgi:hypothetical protein
MIIDYAKILTENYAGQEWTLNGDDYEGLTWLSDLEKPAKETLDKLWESTLASIIAKQEAKNKAKIELLDRLNITQAEAELLLG